MNFQTNENNEWMDDEGVRLKEYCIYSFNF